MWLALNVVGKGVNPGAETALVGLSDEVKLQRVLRYVLHSHHQEVGKVVDAANGSWARFRDMMQRKYRLGDGLLTMADLEAMNKDDFSTIGAFVHEFKRKARKVHGISEETQCAIFLGLPTGSEASKLTGHGGGNEKLTWATIDKGVEEGNLDQVEQHQMRLQRRKRNERDATASGTPGVKRIVTDVLAALGYDNEVEVQKRGVTVAQGRALGPVEEEARREDYGREETGSQILTKAQRKQRNLQVGGQGSGKGQVPQTIAAPPPAATTTSATAGPSCMGPAPACGHWVPHEKEEPTVRVEEIVGDSEEVTQRLKTGTIKEEPIVVESDDEGQEGEGEPTIVLLGRMEDLLENVGNQEPIQAPSRKEPEPERRKEVVEVPEEEEEDDDKEDERLRQKEDQRAELRAKKRGAREEVEPSLPDSVRKRKKYAVRMEEGFDVERMVDKLLEGHNDLMNLKDILASAPRLRGELKGRLSRRLTVLPREVEWTEAGTRMNWKYVACGQVDLVIRNQKCTGMVDTGAEMNIIREKEAVMIGMEIDHSDHGMLHDANCKAAFCGTASNVIIEIGKVRARTCFFVMPDVDHPILLGRSFLCRTKMLIFNKHDGTMILLLCDPTCGNYEVITCRNMGPGSGRNRPNLGSFTFEESENEQRRLWEVPEEEDKAEVLRLSLTDVNKAMEVVSAHDMADPEAIKALREQVLENPQVGEVELVYRFPGGGGGPAMAQARTTNKKCRPVPVLVTEDEEAYYERERGLIRCMREHALAVPCRINDENEGKLIIGKPNFLSPQERALMLGMMKERHRAYAFNNDERRRLDVDKILMIRIHTVLHEPWNLRGARYPNLDEEKMVVDYLDGKMRMHVADYSSGPYASPWFCFIKPNGTLRWVQDLQRLNAVIVRDAGGLPNADALSESCAGRPIISLIDLYSGYDQFPVYQPDRPVTAMHTPKGLIHMNVAPQGWTNAVAMVQRHMIRVMQTVSPHITQPYIDDLPVKGPKEKEEDEVMPSVRRFVWKHIQDIDQVLGLLEEHNLTASGPKRLILRVDPTALACSLKNYTPSDPTVARWLTFNFELERIPGNKNRADGLSRINWDGSDEESIEDTPPVDGFLDQKEDVRLHINEWSLRVPSCVSHPIWLATKGYEQKEGLVLKPFQEEDPWGSKDVGWMMKLALAGTHNLVEEVRTIEEGPAQVEEHEQLMGGMYLLTNTLLQGDFDRKGSFSQEEDEILVPESLDDEFEEGEIKEAFRAEEYDGIYMELGLLLSCEMRDRDASAKAQKMRHLYVVRDGHLFIKRQVGNPRRIVCGRDRQIDIIAALHDGIAGGHRGALAQRDGPAEAAQVVEPVQAAGPAQAVELPPTYGLEQVEFHRITGSDLRGPSLTLPEGGETVSLRMPLDRLEAHLDASQWGASQLEADESGPARYEPVEDEPEEEPHEPGPETGSREPEESQTEGVITVENDTPPPAPIPEQARQYWPEGIPEPDSEEMLGPPSETTMPPPTQAEPEEGERARTPTTMVRLEELYQEKLRMEAAGEAPKPPIDLPTSEQRISEAWASYEGERDAARLRLREAGQENVRVGEAQETEDLGFSAARMEIERADKRIGEVAVSSFQRYSMLSDELATSRLEVGQLSTQLAEERAENQAWRTRMEAKEAEWEKRLQDMAAMVERLSATTVVDWTEQSRYGIQGKEVQGLFGQEGTTETPQQEGMGKVFLDPTEAAARRETEEGRFSFRTPTESASQQATPMTIEIPEGELAQGPQPPVKEGGPIEESPTILLEVQEGALTGAAASTEPEAMGGEASRLDELVAAMELDMPSGEPQRQETSERLKFLHEKIGFLKDSMPRSRGCERALSWTSQKRRPREGTGHPSSPLQNKSLFHAVALQDHIARGLRLKENSSFISNVPLNSDGTPSNAQQAGSSNSHLASAPQVANGCSYQSPGSELPEQPKKEEEKKKKNSNLEPEKTQRLTLAQRYGLVERPPPPLSAEEWKEMHQRSRDRHDSMAPCPICREVFKEEEQVLLSCSHVFHKACIQSFERFAQQKCCPLCRAMRYQKRRITDGLIAYRHVCATRIQALYRAYRVRKWFKKVCEKIPPKDPKARREFFARKLEAATDGLVTHIANERNAVDELLSQVDRSLVLSRRVCQDASLALNILHSQQQTSSQDPEGNGGSVVVWPLSDQGADIDNYDNHNDADIDNDDNYGDEHLRLVVGQGWVLGSQQINQLFDSCKQIDWDSVIDKALRRGDTECPICISPLHRKEGKPIAWLSCSHVFHVECIQAFEDFSTAAACGSSSSRESAPGDLHQGQAATTSESTRSQEGQLDMVVEGQNAHHQSVEHLRDSNPSHQFQGQRSALSAGLQSPHVNGSMPQAITAITTSTSATLNSASNGRAEEGVVGTPRNTVWCPVRVVHICPICRAGYQRLTL
ncbi:hypothetical protein CBR_g8838 [Chara braunii]|uniref:RING-type domain-containing protein n=1 Tax=Chara braunii TaxID=69332 RepID=A0A388KN38_CHABU|nr:hypothetical protein CBR_g8838 [Chara braunii]|eukprot:GBG71418.1 hypothetical protein CBR_g8838 [Chara braunii]